MDADALTALALVITAFGTLLTAVVSAYNVVVSKRNELHIKKVVEATNGMSKRLEAESLARGTAEGKAVGLEQGRAEQK